MKSFSSFLLAAALTLTGAGPAIATVMQYTATATAVEGSDGLGLFGPAGSALAGKSFALTISFDTDLNNSFANGAASFGSAPASIKVVLGGIAYSVLTAPSAQWQYASASAMNTFGPGAEYDWGVDQFSAGAAGDGANGLYVSANLNVQSKDQDFVTSLTTATNIRGTSSPASLWIAFDATGADGTVTHIGSGSIGSFDVGQVGNTKPVDADVPEPASLALVSAGLLALSWRRRSSRGS
jgi:hypothetical protein